MSGYNETGDVHKDNDLAGVDRSPIHMADELQLQNRAIRHARRMEKQMEANEEAMDVLVLAELMRLERDHSRLECLYEQLPNAASQPKIGERFFSLWSDVEKRAQRLEYILDRLA